MKKEYGGYLPIEFASGTPYYSGDHVIALNSGRYAIAYALQALKWDAIYLPFYICSTVEETIRKELPQMQIRYYHIDKRFFPKDLTLQEHEGLLWVNYFGIQSQDAIEQMLNRYGSQLLIDNTQAFFSKPRQTVCQVYSCRKFFGVSDGAYAIGTPLSGQPTASSGSSLHAAHLLQSYEYGTNYSYALNKENEDRLGRCRIESMSPLTSAMLNTVDYSFVQQQRIQNMTVLHEILGKHNQIQLPEMTPALYYPFLFPDKTLRSRLIQQKIYIPQLWNETSENEAADPWERHLSDCLCPLPIDQRYDAADMHYIGNQILQLIHN